MLKAFTATDIGPKRTNNEDSLACLARDVFVIADGMGGCAAGEIASRMLVDTVDEVIKREEFGSELVLKKAILQTNAKIIQAAKEDKSLQGMGTTASVCQCSGDKLFWAHVGDSRIYLCHQGKLQQITRDHSLVYDLVAEGTLTEEEARFHPQRNLLTRAVGADDCLQVDTGVEKLCNGDLLVLCTDGLSGVATADDIMSVLQQGNGGNQADKLVQLALQKGSTDNVSVIVVRITAE